MLLLFNRYFTHEKYILIQQNKIYLYEKETLNLTLTKFMNNCKLRKPERFFFVFSLFQNI